MLKTILCRRYNEARQKNKRIQIGKKLDLFLGNMITYLEYPKDAVSIWKSFVFLLTKNK